MMPISLLPLGFRKSAIAFSSELSSGAPIESVPGAPIDVNSFPCRFTQISYRACETPKRYQHAPVRGGEGAGPCGILSEPAGDHDRLAVDLAFAAMTKGCEL